MDITLANVAKDGMVDGVRLLELIGEDRAGDGSRKRVGMPPRGGSCICDTVGTAPNCSGVVKCQL